MDVLTIECWNTWTFKSLLGPSRLNLSSWHPPAFIDLVVFAWHPQGVQKWPSRSVEDSACTWVNWSCHGRLQPMRSYLPQECFLAVFVNRMCSLVAWFMQCRPEQDTKIMASLCEIIYWDEHRIFFSLHPEGQEVSVSGIWEYSVLILSSIWNWGEGSIG